MTQKEFIAAVEGDAEWIKKYCHPLRLAVNFETGSPIFWTWKSEDGKSWSASLFLRGNKRNEKGEVWCYVEGFCSADDYPRYQYLRNRMIERYRECAKTGEWKPRLDDMDRERLGK